MYHQSVPTPRVDPDEVLDVRAHHHRDGLQRIDYMGEKVLFHGLEQVSAMMEDTVWFMNLGAM